MLKLEKHTDRHGRTGWYLRDAGGVWVAHIYQSGDPAEDGDVLPTPREAYDWAQRIIAALTTPAPQPSADDVALVKAVSNAAMSYARIPDDGRSKRLDDAETALLAALSQRRADRDAVIGPAARDVLAERERQKSAEGWTPEHDDEHDDGQLASAAACYALNASGIGNRMILSMPRYWPWADEWWKPTTPRRNLVKAAALILAEIERLDRAAIRAQGEVT